MNLANRNFLILVLLISIDQVVKFFARIGLANGSFFIFNDIAGFQLSYNYGIWMGIHLLYPLTIIFNVVAIALIIYFFLQKKTNILANGWLKLGCLLILSGAISNLIDRIFFGFVTDYIAALHFTIFNLADVFIVVGIIVCLLTYKNKK